MSEMLTEDLMLMQQAAERGDDNAIEALLRYYHEDLITQIRRMLGPQKIPLGAPEDIAQETLISVFLHIEQFRAEGPNSFFHWMVKIASNKIADAIRTNKAFKRAGDRLRVADQGWNRDSLVALLDDLSSAGETPSFTFAMGEAIDYLQAALATISPEYRRALQCRYLEGLSIKETARVMDKTPKSIEGLCMQGMKSLRTYLGAASRFPHRS